MNPERLTYFKGRLETERDELIRAHGLHEQDLRDSHTSEDIAGPDRASELDEAIVESHIVESQERLLEKINHALERLGEGTYGICENCDCEIAEARLEAKPSVSLCVDCQELKEAG
ncbi:MAG: TraR/DksA family transcriptional regulator [Verrucomicrobiae bacterium]|nr:TraR/DksA family transcriptional regulator [Verrucomicrobiae bacterium]